MTVGTTESIRKFTVTGSESQFDFSFSIVNTVDLEVTFYNPVNIKTPLTLTTHYTITPQSVGGTLYKTANFPSGTGTLVVKRKTPILQNTRFVENQKRPSKVTEDAFDKNILICQEIKNELATALKVTDARTIDVNLPNPQAKHLIGWNDDATAITHYPVTFSTIADVRQINSVDTVAELRVIEPISQRRYIAVHGHTSPGIGGGWFYYDPQDTTTADDNGLTIVTSSGKRWKRVVENGFIDSDMFGGDVHKVVQGSNKKNAIKLLSNYNLSSKIILNSDTVLDCNGYTIIPDGYQSPVFEAVGSLGSYSALTANSLAGSDEIRTNLVLTVGQYVHVRSQTLFPSPNGRNGKYGQIFRITQVVSTGIYKIDRAVDRDFLTSATAEVAIATMKTNIEIKNLVINNHNYTDSNLFGIGVLLRYCDNVKIDKPILRGGRPKYSDTINYLGRTAIVVSNCLNVTITDPQFYHTGSYGIEISGASHNIKVNGGYGYDTRHVVSVNWVTDGYGEPIDVWINDMIADHTDYSGFDTHDRGRNINFVRCISRYSVRDSGFQQRNNEVYYFDCIAHGNFLNGFVGRDITAKGQLTNCKAYNNLDDGIQYVSFGAILINCQVWNNASAGFDLTSGKIIGGYSKTNQYSVRIPYLASDTDILVISNLEAPLNGSTNYIFWSGIDNYNIERTILNSNILYCATTPFFATPSGDKNGKYALTDGHNKVTAPSATQNRAKGRVVLSGGTARVTVPVHRYISTSGTAMSFIEKIRTTVIIASNAGALRVVLDNSENYFDIFSTSASDASTVEWEITGT